MYLHLIIIWKYIFVFVCKVRTLICLAGSNLVLEKFCFSWGTYFNELLCCPYETESHVLYSDDHPSRYQPSRTLLPSGYPLQLSDFEWNTYLFGHSIRSNVTTVDCLKIEFNARLTWVLSIGKSSFHLNPELVKPSMSNFFLKFSVLIHVCILNLYSYNEGCLVSRLIG
jgi:hypothetical protein